MYKGIFGQNRYRIYWIVISFSMWKREIKVEADGERNEVGEKNRFVFDA